MKSSEHITREQLDRVADILELGRIKYNGTIATMRCPFYRSRKHNFIVDMTTGKYHCNYCGRYRSRRSASACGLCDGSRS